MTTKITLSNITDSVAANLVQVQTLATVAANLQTLATVSSNLLAIGQANAATGGGAGTSYGEASSDNSWFGLPVGNTAQRSSAGAGAIRLNQETEYVEIFFGNTWVNLKYLSAITASGGTITTAGSYKIHTFNTSGTFTVSKIPEDTDIEYIVLGGGGGATGGIPGVNFGAGGASGVFRSGTIPGINGANTYTITIGGGSSGASGTIPAGSSSIIEGVVTAAGGNGAPSPSKTGASNPDYSGGSPPGSVYAGGGAGAGGNGSGMNGGIGVLNTISGSAVYYGGGGGGGSSGSGGLGGGGSYPGGHATANRGGGGGGNSNPPGVGGNGGSGVVIFKYRFE